MKNYKLIITPLAKGDIAAIVEYLINFSPEIALRYADYIYEAIHSLAKMPTRCSLVRDEVLKIKGYRWTSVRNYTIFFIVDDTLDIVRIERVLYSRREYDIIL